MRTAISKLSPFFLGAFVVAGGAGWALRSPSVARIELEKDGELYLVVGADVLVPTARAVDANGNILAGVKVACTSDTPRVRMRDGKLSATEAVRATITCSAGGAEARFKVKALDTYTSATIGYELRPIPAGTFKMGTPASQANRSEDETQHDVTLTHAYLMGTTEVTQAQWEKLTGTNPSEADDGRMSLLNPSYPVQNVSWCDAVVFANKLSEKDGLSSVYVVPAGMTYGLGYHACNELAPQVMAKSGADGYRLPTEAEWERAAGGGSTDTWSGVNREADLCGVANVADATATPTETSESTVACDDHHAALAQVGSYAPNAFGMKDMTGNVYEWTWDTYGDYPSGPVTDPQGASDGPYRVDRGGSSGSTAFGARIAHRDKFKPGERFYFVGLRLARTVL